MHNTYASVKADPAYRSILLVELVCMDSNNYFQRGYCGDASSVSSSDRKATTSWPCRNSIWRSIFGNLHLFPGRLEPQEPSAGLRIGLTEVGLFGFSLPSVTDTPAFIKQYGHL